MPWINDTYYYTKRTLQAIAETYDSIYWDGLLLGNYHIDYLKSIAEYKADFDRALDFIGRGYWRGTTKSKHYRQFGKLQRLIIGDILGKEDWELGGWGLYDVSKLRGIAYFRMLEYLNERRDTQS